MSILDAIYNYYERVVLEEVAAMTSDELPGEDFVTDVVCVALNQLPCRYFRYGVDMAFYLPSEEFDAMRERAREAVKVALEKVRKNEREAE